MCGFASLSPPLFDPTRPGRTEPERLGDLFGLHPPVIGAKYAIAQVL